ncbi:MAG TPA: hypothetical protein VNO26_16860 [Candidatus Limnocylindria bacterium]|nr:hypothetical protein [Candidatus Limnocylindria bacterium]
MLRTYRTPGWRPLGLCAGLLAALACPAPACDLHMLRTGSAHEDDTPGLRLGLVEQWTHYATLQDGDHDIPDPDDQRLDSAITQLVARYRFTDRIAAELRLPYIHRDYRRPRPHGGIERGDVSGFGDLALLADVVAFRHETDASSFQVAVFGGLELPSGDPDRLREESEGHHAHDDTPGHTRNGIHGHDLALGSGSVDGIVGMDLFWAHERLVFLGSLAYGIRGEGSFDYRYANDLQWAAGPGVQVWRAPQGQAGLMAVLSGETKGQDELDGERLDDTAATTLYVGPTLRVDWMQLEAEVAVDVPVITHRTAVQIAPDLRVRGALRWRFGDSS